MVARRGLWIVCALAASLLLSACAVVQYPSGETDIVPFNDPAFNVQGRHYGSHGGGGAPGMLCRDFVHVNVTSDSSKLFATAEYWASTWPGPPYFLGTGVINVNKVDYGEPDSQGQNSGVFERKGLKTEATCEWGGWAVPPWAWGTVELAVKPGHAPDWPTYDELLAWCEEQWWGDDPWSLEHWCPWGIALPQE